MGSEALLAGLFLFTSLYHSTEAARMLGDAAARPHLERFLREILKLPEIDGGFVDAHQYGKCYATAMALLALRNCVK